MNIPEAAVEAAAKAIYEHCTSLEDLSWADETDSMKGHLRNEARAAIEAAAPSIVAHLADTMPIETLAGADGASVWLRGQA